MNKHGKIKIVVLLVFAIANLILFTSPPSKTDVLFPSLSALITGFGGVLLLLSVSAVFSKERYCRPSWNDKLFKSENRLSNYLFAAVFFIVIGSCISAKTGVIYQSPGLPGIVSLTFGISILIATYLACLLFRPTNAIGLFGSASIVGKWRRETQPNSEENLETTNYNWTSITFNPDATFSISASFEDKYLGVSITELRGGLDLKGSWRIDKNQLYLKSEGLPTNFFLIYKIIQTTRDKLVLLSSLAKSDAGKKINYYRNK